MLDTLFSADPDSGSGHLFETLKKSPKRIVFTDGEDIRVLRAAEILVGKELVAPILLGSRERVYALAEKHGVSMQFINVIDPERSTDLPMFEERLERVEKFRGRVISNAREMICNPHNFGAMMVQYGQADGMVAGNKSLPASIFRAVSNFIKPLEDVPSLFGVVVMVAPTLNHMGSTGMLFLADCGMNPEPNVDQLASFGVVTGKFASRIIGKKPKVAFLSHSTQGCMSTPSSQKMAAATSLAVHQVGKESLALTVVGEVQADVALDPQAAEIKSMGENTSTSDVLVFPGLDAAHIGFKLLQHVGGARHFGQLILGLTRPAAQVPRTTSVETLLGTAILVGVEAVKGREVQHEWE